MRSLSKTIGTVCSAWVLVGCAASTNWLDMKIVPAMRVTHSGETADRHLVVGRYYHGARRFADALTAYQRAIELDAGHVGALNAIGILHAERGEYVKAIAVLRQATNAGLNDSYSFSNLGFAFYLNGDFADAAIALEKATSLDPANLHARNNLDRLQRAMGRTERSDDILASERPISEANVSEVQLRTEIAQVGQSVFELRQASKADQVGMSLPLPVGSVSSSPFHQSATLKEDARPPAPDARFQDRALSSVHVNNGNTPKAPNVRVEVSNGNGINGMAKSVGKIIGGDVLRVIRLTNQRSFNIKASRIEYREGHEETARTLAGNLGHSVVIMQKKNLGPSDIRVVLGWDFPSLGALSVRFRSRVDVTEAGGEPGSAHPGA